MSLSRSVGVAVWVVSAVYLAFFFNRGWVPKDEGILGQMAERVLQGELPHRDFDDPYTGLLDFWHALAFRLLGVELTSIRYFLLAAALAFVPLFYLAARRAAPPVVAGAVTLFCVVWSLPCYFASMPSWYNLFLATGGALALLRHVETGRARWLVAAGACAGLSFLVKVVGLYFVAAALLFFVYREQARSEEGESGRAFSWLVTLGLGLFAASLVVLVSLRPGPLEILLFVFPGIALAGFLTWNEWRRRRASFAARAGRLAGMIAPFAVGFVVPVGLFLIPYAAASDLGALFDARFLLSAKRAEHGSYPLPAPLTAVCALPTLLLFLLPFLSRHGERLGRRLTPPAALAAAALVAFGSNVRAYQTVWFTLRPVVPALVVAGLWALTQSRYRRALTTERRQSFFVVLATATMVSIVQFPYHVGLYFIYVAPLVALAWLFLVDAQTAGDRPVPRRLHLVAMAFYFLFALVWLDFGRVQVHGFMFDPRQTSAYLDIDRGGLWVEPEKAEIYERLVREIRKRSGEDDYIYAAPDSPEVYFLSGRRNPTPTFVDFLDRDYGTPGRTERLLALLDERGIDLVVLYWNPALSAMPPDLAAAVLERFPHRLALYPLFTLHWRERTAIPKEDDER